MVLLRSLLSALITGLTVMCVSCQFPNGFDFQLYGTQWSEADAFEVVLPVVLNAHINGNITSVPAGEIYIFGASFGEAVLPTYNPANSVPPANVSTQGLEYSTGAYGGNSGCANRAGSNRFYLIGTSVGPSSNPTNDTYYVFASNDGVTWSNVLDAATTQLWYSRFDDDNTLCVVDLSGNVYDIGSGTTWKSSNQGVTWSNLNNNPAARFSNRTYFAGGIFTSAITGADKIMVIGGRIAPAPSNNMNGGADLNDVWSSADLGVTWVQVTAAAPFFPRDAFSWAAASNGAMVIFGGSGLNGYSGYFGDLWYSADDGATWKLISAQTSIGNYSLTSMLFDNRGYLYLFGGQSSRNISGSFNQYDWLQISAVSTVPLALPARSSSSTGGGGGNAGSGASAHAVSNSLSLAGLVLLVVATLWC